MKPETQKLLEETRQTLDEFADFFATSRNPVHCDQTDSGEPDDLDTLFDRIDEFAPAMQRWADQWCTNFA